MAQKTSREQVLNTSHHLVLELVASILALSLNWKLGEVRTGLYGHHCTEPGIGNYSHYTPSEDAPKLSRRKTRKKSQAESSL